MQNDLDVQTEPPEPGEDAVEVRAHTSMGDITIHRSSVSSIRGGTSHERHHDPTPALEVDRAAEVVRRHGRRWTGSTWSVPEGSVFALLGPNGAGKTTTVQILSTLIPADAGEVRVAGHDPAREPEAVRDAIGVTGQFSAVDNLLTGEENLTLMADLHHLGRGRGPAARRRAPRAARPRARRAGSPPRPTPAGCVAGCDLAMTLMGDPRIIFLDEPTTGLDPRSRRTVWRIVRDLVDRGVTIFLTTHYLEEADQLADRVALLDHGTADRRGHAR